MGANLGLQHKLRTRRIYHETVFSKIVAHGHWNSLNECGGHPQHHAASRGETPLADSASARCNGSCAATALSLAIAAVLHYAILGSIPVLLPGSKARETYHVLSNDGPDGLCSGPDDLDNGELS